MARKSSHNLLAEWTHADGRARAISDKGALLVKLGKGRGWTRRTAKAGLTFAEFEAIFLRAGYVRKSPISTFAWEQIAQRIPNPVEVQAKREAQAKRRQEAEAERRRAQDRAELALIGPPDVRLGADIWHMSAESIACAVATMVRERARFIDPALRYVAEMARFHGGATGGYLGTAIGAQFLIDRADPRRSVLDSIANRVAQLLYGSSNQAASIWARALGGE